MTTTISIETITVYVPQSVAIVRGSAEWGNRPIDLKAVLAQLTVEEREQVDVDYGGRLRARRCGRYEQVSQQAVNSDSADTADVVAAIRASIATITDAGTDECGQDEPEDEEGKS